MPVTSKDSSGFDPSKYGAVEVTQPKENSFDPSKYGAVEVKKKESGSNLEVSSKGQLQQSAPAISQSNSQENNKPPQPNFGMASFNDLAKGQRSASDNTIQTAPQEAITAKENVTNIPKWNQEKADYKAKVIKNTPTAILNSAIKSLKIKGINPNNSAQLNKEKQHFQEQVDNGDATVGFDKSGTPGLIENKGLFDSFHSHMMDAINENKESRDFKNMSVSDRVAFANKKLQETPTAYIGEKPTELGSVGAMVGGALPTLGLYGAGAAAGGLLEMAAPETGGLSNLALKPVMSFVTNAGSEANKSAMNGVLSRYAQIKKSHPEINDEDAMVQAQKGEDVDRLAGIGTAALFSETGGQLGKSVTKNFIKGAIKSGADVGAKTALIEGGKDIAHNMEGVTNKGASDIAKDMGNAFAENAPMGAALHGFMGVLTGITKVPAMIKSALKYDVVSKMKPEEVKAELDKNVQSGAITPDEALKADAELGEYANTLKTVPSYLSDEAKASVTGLIIKRNNLLSKNEGVDKTAQDLVKQQSDAIDSQIKEIYRTGKPLQVETNPSTGEPYENPAYDEVQKQRVQDLADKISKGKKIEDAEDLQAQANFPQELENELTKIKKAETPKEDEPKSDAFKNVNKYLKQNEKQNTEVQQPTEVEGNTNPKTSETSLPTTEGEIPKEGDTSTSIGKEDVGKESDTPLKDEYAKRVDNLDKESKQSDIKNLGVGDYVAIKNETGNVYTGFVKSIGSKNVVIESPYGGYGDADYKSIQELKFPKDAVQEFYKPQSPPKVENKEVSIQENNPEKVVTDKPIEKKNTGTEIEPNLGEGRKPVTLSGNTEEERQAAITQRKVETKQSALTNDRDKIVERIGKYNRLDRRQKRAAYQEANKIKLAVDTFNKTHDQQHKITTNRHGDLELRNNPTDKRPLGSILRHSLKGEERSIVENGTPLMDRSDKTKEVFQELLDNDALPVSRRVGGEIKSENEHEATIQDIMDGIPSTRAENYLNSLEKQIKNDDFDYGDKSGTHKITLSDALGLKTEQNGEPMTIESVTNWLNKDSELTPEDETTFDNIENLITHYEQQHEQAEGAITPKVSEPAKERPTSNSGKTEPTANPKAENTKAEPKVESKETPEKHAQNIKEKFRKVFKEKGNSDEHIDAAIALMDARAKSWASEEKGRTPEQWFQQIADVKNGEFEANTDKKFQVDDIWHGSPHAFDKFSLDKIGTGEGAQAFGHGLYFTDIKGIAEGYAKRLYEKEIDNLTGEYYINGTDVAQELSENLRNGGSIKDWVESKERALEKNRQLQADGMDFKGTTKEGIIPAIEKQIVAAKEIEKKVNRNLYKVSLHEGKTPEQYNWLEWDKREKSPSTISKLKKAFVYAEDAAEVKKEDFISEAEIKINTGASLYDELSKILGSQKEASETLLRAGIDGIKYPAESLSRGATSETARGSNYVVFDENAVTVKEKIQFQGNKGALETLKDGRVVIHALDAPDVSTMVHEIFHVFEKDLTDKEKQQVKDFGGSEEFARAGEKYLRDGNAPTKELQPLFEKFKQWLTNIYQSLKGSPIDKKITPEIKQIFDRLLSEKAEPEKVTEKAADNSGEPPIGQSGVKKAITEPLRTELGLPKVDLPKMGSDSEALQKAKERIDTGEVNPRDLVNRILDNKEGYKNEDEVMDMQYYAHQIQFKTDDLVKQISEAETPESKSELSGKLQQLSDESDRQTEAALIAGNQWGKIGNRMQIVVDAGFNPSRERVFIKDAYDGEIPKDVSEKLTSLTKERDEAIAAKKIVEEKLRERAAKEGVERIKKDAEKTKKRDEDKEKLKAEEKELLSQVKKALKKDFGNLNAGIPIPKETIEVLGKLAVNYFKQGALTVESLVNKMYDSLKDDIDGLDKKQLRDIIAQYEPLAIQQETSRLNKRANSLEDKVIPATVKTVNGKLAGVSEPIDFSKPPKQKSEFRNNTEWVKAQQRVANAEYKIKQLKREAFESKKNMYQKGLMWANRVFRLSVLSGYNVLLKLSAAATIGGAGLRIPSEGIGRMWSDIFKSISDKAPIEGGFNVKAQGRFMREFFNPKKFVQNATEILKSGQSNLSKRLGSAEYEHIPVMYLPTDLHQIIKDPVKRAVFESSMIKSMAWAEKNGLDINDNLVYQSLENAAYKRANYEIFQEKNLLSKKFQEAKAALDKKGNAGATGKFLIDFMIPVSTVPTNIVRRLISTSPLGLGRGFMLAREAYAKGIDKLSTEDADRVMRQLKQGTLGTALYMTGWLAASNFGGLYSKFNPNKKRQEGELASDEMEVDGKMIPKPVQHALPFEIIQMAATARHVYDNYVKNKDASTPEAIYNAGLSSIGALLEQVPIVETGVHAVQATSEPYEAKKLKDDVKRRFEPQILRETGVIKKDEPTQNGRVPRKGASSRKSTRSSRKTERHSQ